VTYLVLRDREQLRRRAREYALYKLGVRRRLLRLRNLRSWQRRRDLAAALPQPGKLIVDHLSRLRSRGFVRAKRLIGDDFGLRKAVSDKLGPSVLEEIAATIHKGTRPFMKGTLNVQDLTTGSIFLRYATQPNVVELVTRYLGEYPYLSSLELQVSMNPSGGNQQQTVTQLVHKDYNDSRMLRFFTYLSDVTGDEDGPVCFLDAEASDRLQPRIPFWPITKPDSAFCGVLDPGSFHQVLGAAGDAFFMDTSRCFHYGSRMSPHRHRIALIATFTTFCANDRSNNRVKCGSDLPAEQRLLYCPASWR